MLQIEVDIMSGRPNPEWILTDPDATKELLRLSASGPGRWPRSRSGYLGLGHREVQVSMIEDDPQRRPKGSRGPSPWPRPPRPTSAPQAGWRGD